MWKKASTCSLIRSGRPLRFSASACRLCSAPSAAAAPTRATASRERLRSATSRLPGGAVTFVGQEGDKTPIYSIIQANGSYSIPRAPLGAVKIAVLGSGHPSGGEQAAPAVVIPPKYGNADSSGLTYTVTKGKQTHDIELTP